MKKLLYFLPFVLIVLSALPVSLYKDRVDFLFSKNPSALNGDLAGALTKLSPSHWKIINLDIGVNASIGSDSSVIGSGDSANSSNNSQAVAPKAEPLYQGAKFRGFPFAAYFSKNTTTNTSSSSSSLDASGYSWLWAVVDVVLFIAALIVSFKVNRKKDEPLPTAQPITAEPVANTGITTFDVPKTDGLESGADIPTQPALQPTNQVAPQPEAEVSQSQQTPQVPPQNN